jgi:hypothetical protein
MMDWKRGEERFLPEKDLRQSRIGNSRAAKRYLDAALSERSRLLLWRHFEQFEPQVRIRFPKLSQ